MELEFKQRYHLYDQLRNEANFILENELKAQKIKTHAILGRVKDFESFEKKITRMECSKPFEEITDVVGLRVICLLRSDIDNIGQLIRKSFKVISEDNKIDGQEISSFGYQSVHFLVKIKPEYNGPRYDSINEITFEIQVRTVAMDAWATVSHYLDYKADHDVPKKLRKDFYALSGLFYVVDTHFELFYQAGKDSRSESSKIIRTKSSLEEELNIDTLRAYLTKKLTDHFVPESDVDGFSEIVGELHASGYKQISGIDSAFQRGWTAYLKYEEENPPGTNNSIQKNKGKKYNAIGAVRGLMSIIDDNYTKHRKSPTKGDRYSKYRHLVLSE
jgi:putative GTP pyrophosphokinase